MTMREEFETLEFTEHRVLIKYGTTFIYIKIRLLILVWVGHSHSEVECAVF